MENIKRTVLFDEHKRLNAKMIDFGGWEMPVNYETGIINEHLETRKNAGLFDVSHMGRCVIKGKDAVPFLTYVLTNNARSLDVNKAQYTIIQNENGGAIDDAYLYRFFEDEYLLVVNASNREKDMNHLRFHMESFDVNITDISEDYGMISIQGPNSQDILSRLTGNDSLRKLKKNALKILDINGTKIGFSKTGYTGEPFGYEMIIPSEKTAEIWRKLIELGASPVGLGARDTLRLEAGMPLYGHELGISADGSDIPVFSVPLAKFAVSFADEKGDFLGRKYLEKQYAAFKRFADKDFSQMEVLPKSMKPIALTGKGIPRAGCKVFKDGIEVGIVTSGTMVPYYFLEDEGGDLKYIDEIGKRSIGLALLNSDISVDEKIEVEIRGKGVSAVVVKRHLKSDVPPFAVPIILEK